MRERTYHGLDRRMRHRVELMELKLVLRSDVDVGALILGAITILRSREDRDTPSIMLNLIAFHAPLMASNNGLQPVPFAKPLRDVRPELQSHASLAGATTRLRLRIGPKHFHHEPALTGLPL